ncbi:hypothetical protein E5288_WYG006549 [Bos mutus]|uniref:Uncharacterized protein n=1 Tax=Bos mutus TaxID=72004 RepID=A0A6B0R7P6_9CETA|nr:hypothetical protein [Bos mutus]
MRRGPDYESRHAPRRPAGHRLPAADACEQVVFMRGVTALGVVTAATATASAVGRRWRCPFRTRGRSPRGAADPQASGPVVLYPRFPACRRERSAGVVGEPLVRGTHPPSSTGLA